MSSLEQQWHTSAAGVSIVISSLGIGRLSVLLIAGMLSDRFGRRPFYHSGDRLLPDFSLAFFMLRRFCRLCLWLFSRYGQQFLDAGTYPSLMEAFPRSPSTANILIKAFVSGGNSCCPLLSVY